MKLGRVIQLLQSARERYSTLQLAIDVSVDDGLLSYSRGNRPPDDGADVRQERIQAWVASPWRWRMRFPTQEQGRDGERYWSTDPNRRFMTGVAGRTSVETPVGDVQPFEELWDPALLIAELWLEPGKKMQVAGRPAISVSAMPRPTPRPSGLEFILLEWPGGDQHELIVDLELGILLRLSSFWRGRELMREEIAQLEMDPALPLGFFSGEGA